MWEGLWTADDYHGWGHEMSKEPVSFVFEFLTQQCPFGSFFPKLFATFLPFGICGLYQLELGLSQGWTQIRLSHHSSDESVFAGVDVHVGSYHTALMSQALLTWIQCWDLGAKPFLILQMLGCFAEVEKIISSQWFLALVVWRKWQWRPEMTLLCVQSQSLGCSWMPDPWINIGARSLGSMSQTFWSWHLWR